MSANEVAAKPRTSAAARNVFMALPAKRVSAAKATFQILPAVAGIADPGKIPSSTAGIIDPGYSAGGSDGGVRFVAANETVIVIAKMAKIFRREIQFGIGNRLARIIFVPTKKRM